jgi:hypothetical protein
MRTLCAAVATLAVTWIVGPALSADLSACRAITDAAARLSCYDALPVPSSDVKTKPAGAIGDDVIATWTGTGTQTTRPFHADGSWEFQWKAGEGLFSAELHSARTGDYVKLLANQTGAGPGSAYVPTGGDFYVEVTALGSWSAKVVRLPQPAASQAAGAAVDGEEFIGDNGTHDPLQPCDYPGVSADLVRVIEGSPLGQTLHIHVLGVGTITTTLSRTGIPICHAPVVTNGGSGRYKFHLTQIGDQGFILAAPEP